MTVIVPLLLLFISEFEAFIPAPSVVTFISALFVNRLLLNAEIPVPFSICKFPLFIISVFLPSIPVPSLLLKTALFVTSESLASILVPLTTDISPVFLFAIIEPADFIPVPDPEISIEASFVILLPVSAPIPVPSVISISPALVTSELLLYIPRAISFT